MTTYPADIIYRAGARTYVGSLVPATTAVRGLAVVLPDWRGRSALALDHAAHLAGLGCTTLVADLYGDGFSPTDPDQVGPMVQQLLEHRTDGVRALSAAVGAARDAAATSTGALDLPVIVVAFSAGAVMALDHARRTREADAVVVCSGLLKTAEPGTDTEIAAPVLLVQGSQDEVSPVSVLTDIVAEADSAGNDLRLLLLTGTHHAFDNPDAGTDPTARLVHSPRAAARMRAAIAGVVDEVCRPATT